MGRSWLSGLGDSAAIEAQNVVNVGIEPPNGTQSQVLMDQDSAIQPMC